MIYFIEDTVTKAIKIGKADDPYQRVEKLQTGNPSPLVLMGVMDGDFDGPIHELFASFRIRGEWFMPARVLLEYIRAVSGELTVKSPKMRNPDRTDSIRKSKYSIQNQDLRVPVSVVASDDDGLTFRLVTTKDYLLRLSEMFPKISRRYWRGPNGEYTNACSAMSAAGFVVKSKSMGYSWKPGITRNEIVSWINDIPDN